MKRRVVITGMGAITPVGNRVDELFAALIAGRSGVGPITRFDAGDLSDPFAAEVKDFQLGRYVEDAKRWDECGANTRFAPRRRPAGVWRTLAYFGLAGVDPTRFGVYLGAGEGTQDFHCILSIAARGYRPRIATPWTLSLCPPCPQRVPARHRIRTGIAHHARPRRRVFSVWKGRTTTA